MLDPSSLASWALFSMRLPCVPPLGNAPRPLIPSPNAVGGAPAFPVLGFDRAGRSGVPPLPFALLAPGGFQVSAAEGSRRPQTTSLSLTLATDPSASRMTCLPVMGFMPTTTPSASSRLASLGR